MHHYTFPHVDRRYAQFAQPQPAAVPYADSTTCIPAPAQASARRSAAAAARAPSTGSCTGGTGCRAEPQWRKPERQQRRATACAVGATGSAPTGAWRVGSDLADTHAMATAAGAHHVSFKLQLLQLTSPNVL